MKKIQFPIGERFGRLVVLDVSRHDESRRCYFLRCICDCGSITVVRKDCLKTGNTRSCGCLHKESAPRKHGLHSTRTYKIWTGMRSRCNPESKSKKKHLYSEKGIRVCDRWNVFENFLSDMGQAPYGMTIERKNGNADYEPGNCVWATPMEQGNNTTRNVRVTYNGKTQTISQWAREVGVKVNTLVYRLRRGWDVSRAITKGAGR